MNQARLKTEANLLNTPPNIVESVNKQNDQKIEVAKDDFFKLHDSPSSFTINELRNKLRDAYREIELKNEGKAEPFLFYLRSG